MNNLAANNIIRFFSLVIIQVLILNSVQVSGYINPYLYVLFILLLPFNTPKWLVLTSAFAIGILIDMFSYSYGMHAAASVLMAFCRPLVISFASGKHEIDHEIQPSIIDFGFKWFLLYSSLLIFIHHFAYFFLEEFTFRYFFSSLFKIIINVIITLILVIMSQYLFQKPQKP